eukprot:gene6331-11764_t
MKIRFTFMLLILACCMLGLAFVILYDPGKQTYFRTLANEITHSIQPRVQIDSTMNDDLVVIFNRVPKTGSTSFMKVVYGLINANKFSSLYVNISIKRPMTLLGESWLIHNISRWKEVRPVIFHGHFPFVNFVKYGSSTNPVYINIIRDPLQRLVSFYYFMRYGDDFLPHKKRKRSGDKTTFDECVQKKGEDCQPELLWLQIPYFCGNSPRCWHPGSKWALAQAKKHLVDQYLVVGVLEEVDKFIRILDNTLPRMFKGAISAYSKAKNWEASIESSTLIVNKWDSVKSGQ